jgi:predicted permease
LLEDDYRRRGLTFEEARVAARRAFGGVEQTKELQRDARSFRWMNDARQDVRYAVRMLRRSPAFTIVAVLTLALGIGANTAVFSVADAVLLRPLPVAAPERLVVLDVMTARGERNNVSYPLFERLRTNEAFSGVLAALDGMKRTAMATPEGGSVAEPVTVQLVSGEYFSVLGATAFAGRVLRTDDDIRGAARPAAVLSHAFWKRRFAADPAVIGRDVVLKGQPFTIVGVTRPEFFGEAVGREPDMRVPLRWQPLFDGGRSLLDQPNVGWLRVMGRLRPGVTGEQASAAAAVMLAALDNDSTDLGRSSRGIQQAIRVSDGSQGLSDFRQRFTAPLRILAAVVAVVLLIACANVSCLLLARATGRRREVAVRLAIGAGHFRLVRQFITESAVLATLGAALGILLAWWGSRLLLILASTDAAPLPIDVSPSSRTLLFTTVVSLGTVLLFGLAPARTASRINSGTSLKPVGSRRPRTTFPSLLVVLQIALSLLLVIGALVLAQTLHNLRSRDLGFDAAALVQVRIVPEVSGYAPEEIPDLSRRLREALSGLPGVQSVGTAQSGFASGTSRTCCIAVEGRVWSPGDEREVRTMGIAPGYFHAIGLTLVRGRDFTVQDLRPGVPPVAIANEAFAREYFGPQDPVGRRVGWGDSPTAASQIEVIGLARTAVYTDLRENPKPLLYVPAATARYLLIRGTGSPQALTAAIQQQIRAFERNLEFSVTSVSQDLDRALVREKLLARLSGFFGVLAALLAGLGLYGLMAYAVAGRTHEIGVRMAIGAGREQVLFREVRTALRLALGGLALGVPAALALGRSIQSQLFGVSVADPHVLAAGIAGLLLISIAAALLPARRAASVNPIIALRAE